jgi:hypothetical protein
MSFFSTKSVACLIQWIADRLLEDPTRADSIYQFIPAPQQANANQVALEAGVQQGLAEIPLLPTANGRKLVLASEAVLDELGLYAVLPDLYHGLLTAGLAVVHPTAAAGLTEALRDRLHLSYIDQDEFYAAFGHSQLTDYYTSAQAAQLLRHLAADPTIDSADWYSATWLFDQHSTPVAPNEPQLYGLLREKPDPNFPLAESVRYLHPNIQRTFETNPAAAWTREALALEPFSKEKSVRDLLLPALASLPAQADTPELYAHYLYHCYRRQELQKWLPETDPDHRKLAKLLVRCDDDQFRALDTCYLSQHYAPPFALEAIAGDIGKAQFPLVSGAYLHTYPEPEGWRGFWLFCGIYSSNAADLLKTKLLPAGVQVAAWSTVKHEAVLRLALDAFTKDPTLPRTELGKLQARTTTGTAPLAECVLPLAYNPHLALLAKLPVTFAPANTLATDYFSLTDSLAVANFFQAGGCKPWEEAPTLTYVCEELVKAALDLFTSVTAVRQLYAWNQEKKLTNDHNIILRALPLYQQDGSTRPAAQTFLSSRFGPEHDIEHLSVGQQKSLLCGSYLPVDAVESEVASWRAFFSGLGVVGKFSIKSYENIPYAKAKELYPTYIDWVDNNPEICPGNHRNYKYQHSLRHLYLINNPELVSNTATAELIAHLFREVEQSINKKPASIYHTNFDGKEWPAGSLLCGFPLVPCTGDRPLRPAYEVYSMLLPAVPPGVPVATVSYGSLSLEKRLGLQTQLTSEDALRILIQSLPDEAVAGASITSSARNKFTAKIFELQADLIGLRKPNPDWPKQLLLPAANSTWVPVTNAYFIANDEFIDPKSGVVLKSLPTLKQDLFQQLCVTLGAKVLDSKDFVDEEAPAQSTDFSSKFCERVARCRVLDLIAHVSGEPPEQAKTWSEQLARLRFLQVPSLRRKSLTIPNYTVPTNDNNSFGEGSFLFVGSLFRGHWARLATFLIKELQLPRSVRPFVIANLLESRELAEQAEVLLAQKYEVPTWLLPAPAIAVKALAPVTVARPPVIPAAIAPAKSAEITVDTGPIGSFETDDSDEEDNDNITDTSLSPEEQKIVHEQAGKAAVQWLTDHQYTLPPDIDEQFSVFNPVKTPDGSKIIKVVVRSALKGRLFFHVYEWDALCEPGTLLLLFCRHTGNNPTILLVTNPAEELVKANPNTYVRVPNSPLDTATLQTLAAATYQQSPDFRYIFLHLPGPGAPPINLAHRRVEEILTADTSSFAI